MAGVIGQIIFIMGLLGAAWEGLYAQEPNLIVESSPLKTFRGIPSLRIEKTVFDDQAFALLFEKVDKENPETLTQIHSKKIAVEWLYRNPKLLPSYVFAGLGFIAEAGQKLWDADLLSMRKKKTGGTTPVRFDHMLAYGQQFLGVRLYSSDFWTMSLRVNMFQLLYENQNLVLSEDYDVSRIDLSQSPTYGQTKYTMAFYAGIKIN